MWNFITMVSLLAVFILLFVRQVRLDRKAVERKAHESNLHVLREMKKFLDSKGKDSQFLEHDIVILQRKLDAML